MTPVAWVPFFLFVRFSCVFKFLAFTPFFAIVLTVTSSFAQDACLPLHFQFSVNPNQKLIRIGWNWADRLRKGPRHLQWCVEVTVKFISYCVLTTQRTAEFPAGGLDNDILLSWGIAVWQWCGLIVVCALNKHSEIWETQILSFLSSPGQTDYLFIQPFRFYVCF